VFQSGIAGGFSSAANMIAKFYLDMAKETFPVVEVQAGEVGTIIVTRGSNLPLKGSTSLKQYSPKEVTMHSTTTANVPQQNQLAGNKVEASIFNNNSIPAGIEGADRAAAEIRQVTQSVNNFATGSGW
jgi:conjugal transfer pilus assembly protein TraB